jgi:RNA polymerase sigma-70 factor (ECF subfamily)
MADTEPDLVRNARTGDRAAFEELVRRTSRLVFARLYLETGDAHRAEDLLQETLLVAFRSLRQLEDVNGFRSWLLKIAQNVAIDAARRDQRQKRAAPSMSGDVLNQVASRTPGPAEEAQRQELRGQVLAILRSLPEEYRLPLTLRYIGDADYETISMQLGLSNGSLRGLLHRGLKLLRTKMQQALGNEAAHE